MPDGPQIREVEISVYTVPTDAPEADGTFRWQSTTMVLAEVTAGNTTGTDTPTAAALLRRLDIIWRRIVCCVSRPWMWRG